ncbi:unnamed protein product [Cochlearia groenlandica]
MIYIFFIILFININIHLMFFCINGQVYDVMQFGAKGDGETDDSEAFVKAWSAMCGSGGILKTLIIPPNNTFLLQPIVFQGPCKSPTVKVQLNGKIVAPINKEAWSDYKSSYQWVSFKKIIGLQVSGLGSIDGRGSSFWKQLHFQGCNDLKISGITSFDSPKNHISISQCKNVTITSIKLSAPEDSPNTDGINISNASDIDIYDTLIETGDDCVAINTGSVNINITRMLCGPGHGISIGSLGRDGEESVVENIQVTNCTFNKTDNGARIKTWPNGKGYAKNIVFEGIKLIETKNPIIIDQNYIDKGRILLEESAVAISNVTFSDISGTSKNDQVIKIDCSEVTYCKDIFLNQIDISTIDGNKPIVECNNVYGKSTNAEDDDECFKK